MPADVRVIDPTHPLYSRPLGGLVSLVVLVLYGMLRGGWLEAVLAAITIGMAMLPEEFPVVLTVFMAMAAWRISRARVLTRRGHRDAGLGDGAVHRQTGILTENRMLIAELRPRSGGTFFPARGLGRDPAGRGAESGSLRPPRQRA